MARTFGFTAARRSLCVIAAMALGGCGLETRYGVEVWRLPESGRLPNAAVDREGTVHLVYFQGEELGGDLLYVRREPDAKAWSEPVPVNSESGTVAGVGPIDGGRVAIGKNGRLHVAWLRIPAGQIFYTRSDPKRGGFERQFGLARGDGMEAAPAIVADSEGSVYLFWHSGAGDEAKRRVEMAVSRDEGFAWEVPRTVNDEDAGACNCCGTDATLVEGRLRVSYRGAGQGRLRGQRLLTSVDAGATFGDEAIDGWELEGCPVTTSDLSPVAGGGTMLTWETRGEVGFSAIGDDIERRAPSGEAAERRKHSSVARNERGDTLLAWSDGGGFRSGGTLHWELFSAEGETVGSMEYGERVPEGSVAIAVALRDDRFAVIY